VGELYYGAYKSSRKDDDLALVDDLIATFDSFPFDEAAAEVFGRIRVDLESKGKRIGPYDTQIAAIALANHATLIRHNLVEFTRVHGLSVEDWQGS
jgi:tRNA(fMet)-specific endonuclease VapC